MNRLLIGALVSVLLVVVAFSMACESTGYSRKIDVYNVERTGNGVVFDYRFIVYGWRGSQASVEFVNPLNVPANVNLTVDGISRNMVVGSQSSAILGTFALANDGPLYFHVIVFYKDYLDIGEVAAVGGESLSVYTSGGISARSLSYFALVEAVFALLVVLCVFLLGRYGVVFEVYNSWIIIFLLWIIIANKIGIKGPLIFNLFDKYPLIYNDIVGDIFNLSIIIKILAVFAGVLGFYSSSDSRVDVFEHLTGVYDRRFLAYKILVNPLLASILVSGLGVGLLVAGGGYSIARVIGYWPVIAGVLPAILWAVFVYFFVYVLSGGVMFYTRRPMLALVVSILLVLFINYPVFFRFSSNMGVEVNDYVGDFALKGLASITTGLLLILARWVRR